MHEYKIRTDTWGIHSIHPSFHQPTRTARIERADDTWHRDRDEKKSHVSVSQSQTTSVEIMRLHRMDATVDVDVDIDIDIDTEYTTLRP